MDKSNLELFKQAINEGLSKKFDSVANCCTEEITYSDNHRLAIRTIVYGKTDTKRTWSPKMKRIIAILVATAILLTSCGVIFRNEIRDFVENVYEFFVSITYTDEGSKRNEITQIYELTYLPEGYHLEESNISPLSVRYELIDSNNNTILFEQHTLDGTYFVIDSENGYTKIEDIQNYEVYYRLTNKKHVYVWNDGKYSLFIESSMELSNKEMTLMIDGIVKK